MNVAVYVIREKTTTKLLLIIIINQHTFVHYMPCLIMSLLRRIFFWCHYKLASSSSRSLLSPPSSSVSETWTLLADSEKRIQAFETKCLRKLFHISYLGHKPTTGCGARSTPVWVHNNLFWQLSIDRNSYGSGMSYATTASPKPFFWAPWRLGRCGRQGNCWMDNIKEWTFFTTPALPTRTSCRTNGRRIFAESSLMFPGRPNRSRDWIELNWRKTR